MTDRKRWHEWRAYWADLFFRMDEAEFDHWEKRLRFDEHTKIAGLRQEYVITAIVHLSQHFTTGKFPKMRDLMRTIREVMPKDVVMANLHLCDYCRKGWLEQKIDDGITMVRCNCEYGKYLRDRMVKDETIRVLSDRRAQIIKEQINAERSAQKSDD